MVLNLDSYYGASKKAKVTEVLDSGKNRGGEPSEKVAEGDVLDLEEESKILVQLIHNEMW